MAERAVPRGADFAGVHVVGASGAEGSSLLLYLVGALGAPDVVGHDFAEDARDFARSFRRANPAWGRDEREQRLAALRRLPCALHLRDRYLHGIEAATAIYASQNWFNYAANLPALPDALARGVPLRGLVDLAMDLFPGVRVGVTGSNGKSTTTALTRHLLARAKRTLQGGNDRSRQVELRDVAAASADDALVWEVSNRHLRDRAVRTDVAVVTNVTRNHVDDHGSFDAYVAAKARLPAAAREAVLPALDPIGGRLDAPGRVWRFGAPTPRGAWFAGNTVWLRCEAWDGPLGDAPLALPGAHNRLNLLAAICAAAAAGVPGERLADGWADFAPLEHRLEPIADQDGVLWLDDLQATTPDSLAAGLRAVARPTVLVMGGDDKGMDFRDAADAATACRLVLTLPGTGTDAFVAAIGGRVPVQAAQDADAALAAARDAARPGDAVLISPGCAFFQSRYLDAGASLRARVEALLR